MTANRADMSGARLNWTTIVDAARDIAYEYDTPLTLRQLFYRLVAAQIIPNEQQHYRRLSATTAKARRAGSFPDLTDESREIHGGYFSGDTSPQDALRDALDALNDTPDYYRRDHSEGQPFSIFLGVEKRGMIAQLQSWFSPLGVPIIATGGFASQTYCDDITRLARSQDRPAVLLYAGDHDPTGDDIERDLIERTNCWKHTRRVALTEQQVRDYALPPYAPTPAELRKLQGDPRAKAFERRYGSLVQYELDALTPTDLRYLYQSAMDEFFDADAYTDVLAREDAEREQLRDMIEGLQR